MTTEEPSLREKILQITRTLLFSDGYSALSMRKIAGEIGVSATSIYLYFDSKDHLVHTLIEESVNDLSVALEQGVEGKVGTLDRFKAIIDSYMEFALNNSEKYQVIYSVQTETMSRYPKEKFRKARRGYTLLESVITKGVSEGIFELEEATIAAYSIWAQLHGVVSVVLNQRLDSRIDKSRFLEESVDYIVQGFLVRTTTT